MTGIVCVTYYFVLCFESLKRWCGQPLPFCQPFCFFFLLLDDKNRTLSERHAFHKQNECIFTTLLSYKKKHKIGKPRIESPNPWQHFSTLPVLLFAQVCHFEEVTEEIQVREVNQSGQRESKECGVASVSEIIVDPSGNSCHAADHHLKNLHHSYAHNHTFRYFERCCPYGIITVHERMNCKIVPHGDYFQGAIKCQHVPSDDNGKCVMIPVQEDHRSLSKNKKYRVTKFKYF